MLGEHTGDVRRPSLGWGLVILGWWVPILGMVSVLGTVTILGKATILATCNL